MPPHPGLRPGRQRIPAPMSRSFGLLWEPKTTPLTRLKGEGRGGVPSGGLVLIPLSRLKGELRGNNGPNQPRGRAGHKSRDGAAETSL